MRRCGECQLCCKLLAVPPLHKVAGQKCQHQKFGKGCTVYNTRGMPPECSLWSCRWRVEDDTADQSRPDRSHVVIDLLPDFVTVRDDVTGELTDIEVVQVWIDPKYPDAHRDPTFRAYLARRGDEGKAALIRYDGRRAFTIIPPAMTGGKFFEVTNGSAGPQHSFADVARAITHPRIKTR